MGRTCKENMMAKYLLLKHYRGGPAPAVDHESIDQWTPDEVDAHMRFMRDWATRLEETGEFVGSPVARLNRAVAVGEADGPQAGLAALAGLDPGLPRYAAVAAYLHERDGDPVTAARLYAEAARSAANLPERDHLTRQAARLNARRSRRSR
jgi:hypothetical protein